MANYYINDKNLSDFGITISKVTGFEDIKRKGKTEYSFPNLNGVQAFTDSSDIIFDARDIQVVGNLVADTIEDANTQFLAFQDWVYQSGNLTFFVDYLGRIFTIYFKDKYKFNRIGNIGGKVYYSMILKLREINPTNKIEVAIASDFDDALFSDIDDELFYINI